MNKAGLNKKKVAQCCAGLALTTLSGLTQLTRFALISVNPLS